MKNPFREFLAKLANVIPAKLATATRVTPGTQKVETASFTTALGAKKPAPNMRQRNLAISDQGSRIVEKATSPEQTFDTSLQASGVPTAADGPSDSPAPPMDTEPKVSASRVMQYLLAKFNPIRGLTPTLLSQYLEQFDLGFLRQASLVWNKCRERDDQIQAVAVKRELKPTDMPWSIVTDDETPEAEQHQRALEDFYNNLTVTHCLEGNTRGGVQLLIKQMMRAVGDKYSVHEIVWQPQDGLLTAELRFVPLWFFEARTGQLRFLPYELALQGIELEQAGWVVHTGEGLFQSSLIAYLYKQLALKTWVNYNEKFGMPFLHGATSAPQGSQEWEDFKGALMGFSSDGAILTSLGSELNAINASAGTTIPMESLLERMDRAIGRIWNGGDLHSMSRGGGAGVGSNPQMESQEDLANADAERITETLNFYVDRWVIKYKFGVDRPLARFVLRPAEDKNIDQDLKIDAFLISVLPPDTLGVQEMLERYGRSKADDGEETISPPAAPEKTETDPNQAPFGNISAKAKKKYNVTSTKIVADELAATLAPVRNRIQQALEQDNIEQRDAMLKSLQADLPKILKHSATSPQLAQAISDVVGTALVAGAADGARETKTNGHSATHLGHLVSPRR